MSAKGTFYVDCGEGGTLSGTGVSPEDGKTIDRSGVDTSQLTSGDTYTCSYSNTSPKTIRFGGEAEAYNYSHYFPNSTNILLDIAPISFSVSGAKIRYIHGNLSAVFPYKGAAGDQRPKFYQTFMNCTNLTEIPGTLFDNITAGGEHMFKETFKGCSSLQEIPSNLFSKLIKSPGHEQFRGTFYGCSSLKKIPAGLFDFGTREEPHNVAVSNSMFWETFKNCAGLQTTYAEDDVNHEHPIEPIPADLFSHITSSNIQVFHGTFAGCSNITSLPEGLFNFHGNNVGGGHAMFEETFSGCKKLKSIPADLFSHINSTVNGKFLFERTFTGCEELEAIPANLFNFAGNYVDAKDSMFWGTFSGCKKLKTIPAGLFSHIQSAETHAFGATFSGCTGLEVTYDENNNPIEPIPADLFSFNGNYINGQSSLFSSTFSGCTKLKTIPAELFSHVKTGASGMFTTTFSGCTGLEYLPENLFASIKTTASSMFSQTFKGCNGFIANPNAEEPAAQYNFIPANLFSVADPDQGIEGIVPNSGTYPQMMMHETFYGTTLRTDCPVGYVQYVTGYEDYWNKHVSCEPASDTNFTVSYQTSPSEGVSVSNQPASPVSTRGRYPYQLADAPTATGYIFNGWHCETDEEEPNVVCDACDAAEEIVMPWTNLNCQARWSCDVDSGYFWDTSHTECINTPSDYKFWITTIDLPANSGIEFTISAKGDFLVDCGENGTLSSYDANNSSNVSTAISGNTITRENATEDNIVYKCTWTTGGAKAVRFGGNATGYYSGSASIAAISFYHGVNTLVEPDHISDNWRIKTINGDLSKIFPIININEKGGFPTFYQTFHGLENLKRIPDTLFSQYRVGGAEMFTGTFAKCTGLGTDSSVQNPVPGELFSRIGVTGTGEADSMFFSVFEGCTNLKKIPENLFQSIDKGSDSMFWGAFEGCTSLKSIPTGLFANIRTNDIRMFYGAFKGCTSLTSIPKNLFDFGGNGVDGQSELFKETFSGCTNLKYLPENLFASIKTSAENMFEGTFKGCNGLTTNDGATEPSAKYNFIPADFFSVTTNGVDALINETNPRASLYSTDMMKDIFDDTTLVTECPAGYYQFITGYEQYWDGHVSCKQCPENTYSIVGSDGPEDCVPGYEIDLTQSATLEWEEAPVPSKLYTIQNVGVYLDAERTQPMTTTTNNIQIPTVEDFLVNYDTNAPENPLSGIKYETSVVPMQSLARTYTGFGIDDKQYIDKNGFITEQGLARATALGNNEFWVAKDYEWDSAGVQNAPSIDADGYSFDGWYDNSEGEGKKVLQLSAANHPEALYANWVGEAVVYNCGEGTGESWIGDTYEENETVTLLESPGECVPPEHRPFTGWLCDYYDGINHHVVANVEDDDFLMPGYLVTCTAKWQQWNSTSFSIIYHKFYCSGEGWIFASDVSDSSQNVRPDNEFTVNHPTMEGHIFNGWNITNMDDNDTHYYSNSQILIDGVIQPETQMTNATSLSNITATHFMNLRTTPGSVTFTADWLCDTDNWWHPSSDNQPRAPGVCTPCTNKYQISYDTGNLAGTEWCQSIDSVDYPGYQYATVGEQNYQLQNVVAYSQNSDPSVTNCIVGPQYTFEPWVCTRDDNGETVPTADNKILEMPPASVTCTTNWVCNDGYRWNNTQTACVPTYAVTYTCGDVDDQDTWQDENTYIEGETVTVPETTGDHCSDAAAAHKVFNGEWACSSGITPDENHQFSMPDANVTCGVVWDCADGYHWTDDSHTACSNTLNLVWDTKGADNNAEVMENLPESCTYKTDTIYLTVPTKTGYDFKGWKVVDWDQSP